jgi:hypothetical protein
MDEKLKVLELKALGVVEKHVEALAVDLADVAKELGDIEIEKANPLLKIVYGATKEQIVAGLKELIIKLDLNKDGV